MHSYTPDTYTLRKMSAKSLKNGAPGYLGETLELTSKKHEIFLV